MKFTLRNLFETLIVLTLLHANKANETGIKTFRKPSCSECSEWLRFTIALLVVVSFRASFLRAQGLSDSFPVLQNPIHCVVLPDKSNGFQSGTPVLKFSPNVEMLASYTSAPLGTVQD